MKILLGYGLFVALVVGVTFALALTGQGDSASAVAILGITAGTLLGFVVLVSLDD